MAAVPPHAYFAVSAVFHYLGPSFAVLLFARVHVLGVAWLRIASAAVVFALWRRPWRTWSRSRPEVRRTIVGWALVLAAMNSCFYGAIDRLPLGTVAAIEFVGPVVLAAAGVRSRRNAAALCLAGCGVYALADVRLAGEPFGFVLAFANAALFTLYIVLGHRAAQEGAASGIDALAAAMAIAAVAVTPVGLWGGVDVLDPVAIAAGVGVGVTSSVVPYVFDQLALARLPRATYALFVSLLPATATVVGLVVLSQVPEMQELAGIALVIGGVALHQADGASGRRSPARPTTPTTLRPEPSAPPRRGGGTTTQ